MRNAQKGESIMTLDGVERELSPEMLVICDEEKPSAVAGVMGGEYSGIMWTILLTLLYLSQPASWDLPSALLPENSGCVLKVQPVLKRDWIARPASPLSCALVSW